MFGTTAAMNGFLPILSSFSAAKGGLLPIVFLAIALDVAIVGVWYVIGVALNNNSVKKSAIGELYQAFGTAIIAFIVIFTILTFSTIFYSSLNATSLMSQNTISTMCTNIADNSPLTLLGSGKGSILESSTSNGICDFVSSPSTVSQQAEYPLAASAVVIANVTNQTARNMNSLFVFDAYMGFLENIAPTISYCAGSPAVCAIPLAPVKGAVRVVFSFQPYIGYSLIYQSANQLIVMFGTAFEAFVAQLVMAQVFLYVWPWLLFGGLLLRATFFTRKIGGLFIAIALGAILIYPAVFAVEYLSLGAGTSGLNGSSYGFNSITNLPSSNGGTYSLNFFAQPRMSDVLNDNGKGCFLAGSAPITDMEAADVGYLLIPFSSAASGITGLFGTFISQVPYFYLPYPGFSCKPQESVNLIFTIAETYGISGVTAYFLPIINIMITLAAIIGLSGLLGGDTSLAGISRLV